jgi:hypothetical protein
VETPDRDSGRVIRLSRELSWPVAIVVALALVVAVNVIFIYVAVSGADDVAPSYVSGER